MTAQALLKKVFDWKVRGVRWIEIIGVVCVAAMIFSVYVAKTAAARESTEIGKLEAEIRENRQRVRLLRAEISHLEQPSRLEALSQAVGLAPVDVRRQATEGQLDTLAPQDKAAPALAPVQASAPVIAPPVAELADEAPQ